ncbi:cytochrome P450 [Micromonospora parathelypteridis]|uniref:Cytochrome P450 n=1 Tax=Micromonospora parathelypteridis TaxID=1839617 RepID=A0A840W0H6_9ACTN|nr:cytochrome P450 [Micromonospora parathelypteridis]MBB5481726.1 cytochrome P450 [Micromonospora parathelypteridis]
MTRHVDVRAALTHPAFEVPAVDSGPYGTLAWLRASVSRFSSSRRHTERRAIVVDALGALDVDDLRHEAARRTAAVLDRAGDRLDVMRDVARTVPLRVLARRLGFAEPAAAGTAVAVVAAAYHPGVDLALAQRADRAVATLLALAPPAGPEVRANLIGLLVQACDATAGLIGAAAFHLLPPHGRLPGGDPPGVAGTTELVAEVLRLDPPVRATRRVTASAVRLGGRDLSAGSPVLLRFDAANRDPQAFAEPATFRPGRPGASLLTFGSGERGCPGDRHALALATGVLDVLGERCERTRAPLCHEPHPTLRVPTNLEVSVR